MTNLTLSIDEKTLKTSREYARAHNMSLNALVRQMLNQRIGTEGSKWIEDFFVQADALKISSEGKTWSRDDLYDV